MSNNETGVGMSTSTTAITNKKSDNKLGLHDVFYVECYSEDGTLKWTDEVHNAITNEGIKYIMDTAFYGATGANQFTENSDWYVGLAAASPTDPSYGDTAAGLPTLMGGTEYNQYSGSNRILLNLGASGTPSGGTVTNDNSAAVAQFTITSPADDVGGCFIVAGTNAITKSSSVTGGCLYGAGAFTGGNKVVDTNDTLNVTVNLTAANA